MEDMERYGDYNEVDEAPGGNKSIAVKLIKILIAVLCISVVGILALRVIMFNYYPRSIKDIYFTESLTAYYEASGDSFAAKTQSLRAPYDDPDVASFMCDNLIVIEAAGNLQISVRYNNSVIDDINKKYGVELDPDGNIFTFKLERVPSVEDGDPYEIGTLAYVDSKDNFMYTYYKLVFEDIPEEQFFMGSWIRLTITVNGVEDAKPYHVLVYENTEDYSNFTEYKLKRREKP